MAGVINFIEKKRSVFIYDYLIYVCGVEISRYVSNLEVTYCDRNGISSATITLTNPFDQWILTPNNLNGIYRQTQDRYSESAKVAIFNRKLNLSKKLVIQKTFPNNPGQATPNSPFTLTQANGNLAQQDFLQRYSFGPGSCIFSKFDTVKVFMKNPYDPQTANNWFPAFTGTVSTKPFQTNYIDGSSNVQLHCYDIRDTLQGMRMSINPFNNTSYQGNPSAQTSTVFINSDIMGFFNDFYPTLNQGHASGLDNIFAGKSFVDTLSMIVTGTSGWVNGGANPTTYATGTGVGFFTQGEVVQYLNSQNTTGPQSSSTVSSLEGWDNLCLFGTQQTWWTQAQCQTVGGNSFWDVGTYSPLAGQMHILIPDQTLNISNLLFSTTEGANNIMASPEWTDRYSLLSKICKQVDYEWGVTGNGDIIFEFPMYDFFPTNFGNNQTIYQVNQHLHQDTISDEGGEVLSGLEATNAGVSLVQGQVQGQVSGTPGITPTGVLAQFGIRTVVISNVLVSKYGARIHAVTFNGVSSAAALYRIALVEFQKRLAEANKLSFEMDFRPFLRPNRPIQVMEPARQRIGKLTTVTVSMPSLKPCSMSLAIGCVRMPLYYNGSIQFQHITGGAGMALSYNAIFEPPDTIGNPDMGVLVQQSASQQSSTSSQ